jgi:riboflavin biosynthesis pyrimidine reductase
MSAAAPLLTTRPKLNQVPKRVAARVVLDRQLRISTESKLVRSCDHGAVIIATSELAGPLKIDALCNLGGDVYVRGVLANRTIPPSVPS